MSVRSVYDNEKWAFLAWRVPLIDTELDALRQCRTHGVVPVYYADCDVPDGPIMQTMSGACRARAKPKEHPPMQEIGEEVEEPKRAKNNNLSNRLPREDFAIIIPFDDRAPLMERCKDVLGDRMVENRLGYFLDGKPANTDKVVRAAGLKYADEEKLQRSPPTRRRKRRRPIPKD